MSNLVFLFPGQGSQHRGMGENLFHRFTDLVADADRQLGYSIKELCLSDPDGKLSQTLYTQPALFVVNTLTYLDRKLGGSPEAQYFAGHSLGEYNALCAAGMIDFMTGLRLVQKRAELMARVDGGGMAAIIGLRSERVSEVLLNHAFDNVDVANFNAPTQTVISGPKGDIEDAVAAFKEAKARAIPLKVSGAFHSRMMKPVQSEFATFLKGCEFKAPVVPVISNSQAQPYVLEKAAETLAEQIARPVRWTESIQYIQSQGEAQFEELGPGTVLTGLVRKISAEPAEPVSPAN